MTAAADLGTFSGTSARSSLRAAPIARRRPALELVAAGRSDARRAPFVAVVVSLLVAGLLGLLVLNTVLAQDAFALHTLSKEGRDLADREQSLSREVEALRSPQALAAKAIEMNMVQAGPPAFLRLPDGAVLGAALPALAPGEIRTESGEVITPEPAPDAAAGAAEDSASEDSASEDSADEDSATEDSTSETADETTDETTVGDDR